ncbi:MAG: NADH-quinone oxidoreductase subunit M [Acidimicrobiia bacterium]|nr:NADH-quinone oxidoreductase subunit M [Acidimicrobiia bacterium]
MHSACRRADPSWRGSRGTPSRWRRRGWPRTRFAAFETGTSGYQMVEQHSWMGELGAQWLLGIDGISLFMVALTGLLFPIGLLASARLDKPVSFTFWMLALEAAVMGVFLSLDLVLFFVFFEFVLVPMYFIIAGWGHGNRAYAATKFFVYTMAGSAFLFVGILAIAFLHHHDVGQLTFDLRTLVDWAPKKGSLSAETARWLFLAFTVAFAVKIPLFPLHTWLPDAHTEAPTAGSVVLASVLLKMGTYGFLRLAIPLFPKAAVDLAPLLLVLATIGIVYGAIVAAMQPDLKRLIAYSSVAHLGFVVLGTFAFTTQGLEGGLFTMLSHGLTTGALFLLVGMLYDRRHTRLISDFGGLWKSVPVLGGLFVATAFASIGLPGFSGFVGEFLVLLGTFLTRGPYAIVATTGVILAAVYLLWAVQRSFTGEPSEENAGLPDITGRELMTVLPLIGLSLFLGFYPKPVLDRIEPDVRALVQHVEQYGDGFAEPDVARPGAHDPPAAANEDGEAG